MPSHNGRTRVLLVDSPRAVREALTARLSLEPCLAIVGAAEDAPHAMSLAEAFEPDVVLVDAEASGLDTVRIVRALIERESTWAVVVLTQHAVLVRHRLNGSPAAVVGKSEGMASLVHAIHSASPSRRGCT